MAKSTLEDVVIKNLQKSLELSCQEIHSNSVFEESIYVEDLKTKILRACGGNYKGNSGTEEISFREIIFADKDGNLPKDYLEKHMGGTDIVFDYVTRFDRVDSVANCLGVEFKPFYESRFQICHESKNKDHHFMNVPYFVTGNNSSSQGVQPHSKGTFMQNDEITICKEGQILSDVSMGLKVLAKSRLQTFITTGIFIYHSKECKEVIRNNVSKLLNLFFQNTCQDKSALKIVLEGKCDTYINMEEIELSLLQKRVGNLEKSLWIGEPIEKNGVQFSFEKKLYLYPFFLTIDKDC